MPVVEALAKGTAPKTFSKGSGQYAGIKQQISNCDFDNDEVKITCADTDEKRKTLIAVRTYLSKQGLNDKLMARTNNLEIWVVAKA